MKNIAKFLFFLIFLAASTQTMALSLGGKKGLKGCVTHTTTNGQTLESVLRQYRVTYDDVEPYNQYLDGNLSLGEIIYIPKDKIGKSSMQDVLQSIEQFKEEEKPKETATSGNIPSDISAINHRIKDGDTLYSISRRYGVTMSSIYEANPSIEPSELEVGEILKIDVTSLPKTERQKLIAQLYNRPIKEKKEDSSWAKRKPKEVKNFSSPTEAINVSLLLPLKDGESQSTPFVQFYQGFLVGLGELKNQGISVNLDVINSGRDMDKLESILSSGQIDNSDLIVGPVYDQQFSYVARYAAAGQIPIVSPLGEVTSSNPFVFQVAPTVKTRYDKLREVIEGCRVILLKTASDDPQFIADIKKLASQGIHTVNFDIKRDPQSYIPMLSSDSTNVLLVAADAERDVDGVISKIGAIKDYTINQKLISVVNPKVTRFGNIDPANFFKANMFYTTSYHADRSNSAVLEFDRRYISSFSAIPSLYSYRGYDVALYFLTNMKQFGSNFYKYINDSFSSFLQTSYNFKQLNNHSDFENQEWMLVNYTPNFEIVVK